MHKVATFQIALSLLLLCIVTICMLFQLMFCPVLAYFHKKNYFYGKSVYCEFENTGISYLYD